MKKWQTASSLVWHSVIKYFHTDFCTIRSLSVNMIANARHSFAENLQIPNDIAILFSSRKLDTALYIYLHDMAQHSFNSGDSKEPICGIFIGDYKSHCVGRTESSVYYLWEFWRFSERSVRLILMTVFMSLFIICPDKNNEDSTLFEG